VSPSPAISIVNVYTPPNRVLVDCTLASDGFTAQYFWGANGQNYGTQSINYIGGCSGGVGNGNGIDRSIAPSRYFGWNVGCWVASSCASSSGNRLLAVNGIQLEAQEDSGPAVLAIGSNNLWYQRAWVRGTWPITVGASDPSGVCGIATIANGQVVDSWTETARDTSSWTQCHGSQLSGVLDTTRYPNGHLSLVSLATNAAGVWSTPTRNDANGNAVLVDNSPVGLTLSGPADAPSTSGTQYVNASATAGPSGVAGIACSLDGSPYQWHPGAGMAIPVQGLGAHHVSCYARNNATDANGNAASSPTQTWTLTIREPTVFGIGFTRLVDALRCRRVLVRVRTPGRWVTIHRHHRPIWVYRGGHTKLVTKVRCRPRTVVRRIPVWSTVRRHGELVRIKHVRLVHVVVFPHSVNSSVRRLAHGRGSTVSGWLGTQSGTALAGQPVVVLAAPDNGSGRFTRIASVATAANGAWSARIPPGPSRLIEAVYAGTTTTEPAVSNRVRVAVPARVRISVRPTSTHWGATIHISGRLQGGYVPPAGELVVLWIGWPGGSTEIGHLYARADGRFSASYTFLRGNGTETYKLWAASARESDYPYTPARSRPVAVHVRPG
jgi:hypothetical protein